MARDGYRTMRMAEGTAAMLTRLAGEYELTYTRMADAVARGWDMLTDAQKLAAIRAGKPRRRPGPRAKKVRAGGASHAR